MSLDLTSEQINQLKNLGLSAPIDTKPTALITSPQKKLLPLLSISGITILSFSGLVLLRSQNTPPDSPANIPPLPPNNQQNAPSPTQVPKSIQHFLLASQQYFSQALQNQNQNTSQNDIINLLNQAIIAATQAIESYPQDYRGYHQRARIYQSIAQSQAQFLDQAINDLTAAARLNPDSPEITRDLAANYAKKGDAQNTLNYLAKTIILEPTKAQNFYDLARLQQQAGQIPQAINTYGQLLTLITDPNQIDQVTLEKKSLENLLAQTNIQQEERLLTITPPPATQAPLIPESDSPLLQASDTIQGLIIAAPQQQSKIEVNTLTDDNALSGTATLKSGQQQITITNAHLTPTTQIYVSTIKGGKNQTLKVLSRTSDFFTVGLDSAIQQDIEFKWWIIN